MKLTCILFLFATIGFAQSNTTLSGRILDENMGDSPLPFANVSIKGSSVGTTSDFEGYYKIKDLETGVYTVVYSYVGYETVEIPNVEITKSDVSLDVSLATSSAELDEIIITAVARKNSEVALLLDQKAAINISESIGAVELSKLGVSNVSGAATKISGVTASEGSGDLYIRGLGDRYLTTTYNGLPIPSDDVERKNIDLGLFSTQVVESVEINKAYTSNLNGDQTSGNINIISQALSGSEELAFGLKAGFNTSALDADMFRLGAFDKRIDFGFYNQKMSNPVALTEQPWNTQSQNSPLDFAYNISAGKRFDDFKILVTASQKADFEYRSGSFQEFDNNNFRDRFTDVDEFIKTVTTSALLDLQYDYGDEDHIKFASLFVNKLSGHVFEAGRNGEGIVFDEVDPSSDLNQFVRDQNIQNTQLWINQLIGENQFKAHKIDWALGFNTVNADEPNRIRNELNFNNDRVELGRTGGFQQRKSNQEIQDYEFNSRINDSFCLNCSSENEDNKNQLMVDLGANFRYKDRSFLSQFNGLQETRVNTLNPSSIDDLSGVFTQGNIANGSLMVRQIQPDIYDADLKSLSGYVMFNYHFEKWDFNFGARYQKDDINVNFNVNNYPGRTGLSTQSYDNFFPSLNLKYAINEKNNLKLSASKTISLPEFKEISPFEYVSQNGQVSKGNPDIQASENYNLDLKWEIFPTSNQLVSVTGFYKQINDPINRVLSRGASGIFSYFNSGEQAEIYGVEFDTKLDIISSQRDLDYAVQFNLNATRMWHEQDLKEVYGEINGENLLLRTFRYNGKSKTGLQGASDWVFNANTTFKTTNEFPFVANISANYTTDKIFALGNPENQDLSNQFFNEEIIEKGFLSLDAVIRKEINENISVRFIGKNLLNPKIERTQLILPLNGGVTSEETVRSYTKGMQLSIEFKYKF